MRKECASPVHVLHIPRGQNHLADWLSRCGATVEGEKDIRQLLTGEVTEDYSPKAKPELAVTGPPITVYT